MMILIIWVPKSDAGDDNDSVTLDNRSELYNTETDDDMDFGSVSETLSTRSDDDMDCTNWCWMHHTTLIYIIWVQFLLIIF